MVCYYVHNNNNNHIWNTYDSLHRNNFLPFLKQRGVEQYQMIRQTKQLVPAYGGSESKKKRLPMMYPKTVGPFPVNVETRGNFLLTSLLSYFARPCLRQTLPSPDLVFVRPSFARPCLRQTFSSPDFLFARPCLRQTLPSPEVDFVRNYLRQMFFYFEKSYRFRG